MRAVVVAAAMKFEPETSERIERLLSEMTLDEKVGQMSQLAFRQAEPEAFDERVRLGTVGSFLNAPTLEQRNRLQRIAVEESRLGIPLIFGRDVIHGFRTIFPLPLGQAATFDPELVEECAAAAAREASEIGVDWTFAPMIDVGRDPRWGRVAESFGEDATLSALLGEAMVRGFQGADPAAPDRVAACAKHFAGYGASESGKDYSTTYIPEQLLREVHLKPFEACVRAGALTLMSAFTDLNGVPATANPLLLTKILREEWGFSGFVVSDWGSTQELCVHGLCETEEEAARLSAGAGLDMEMATTTFIDNLPRLVTEGRVKVEEIDVAVRRILQVKEALGLFETPYRDEVLQSSACGERHLELSRRAARQSFVLLKNEGVLPLSSAAHDKVALIGCLGDDARNQLGCWAYDADEGPSISIRTALEQRLGTERVLFAKGVEDSRSHDRAGFDEAVEALRAADVGLVVLGEHWNISGECRSRAFIDLPGAQAALLEALVATGKPIVLVVLTGRPLTIARQVSSVSAALVGFHGGTMTGPALVDLLLGDHAPSGKLPMTFPRSVGQIPIYYASKNGGRPAALDFKGIPEGTPLDPVGFDASYLDSEVTPAFPFGFGLSYAQFAYSDLKLPSGSLTLAHDIQISCDVQNEGHVEGTEVVQLYIRDLVGSVTRPIRELKAFRRVHLAPGERRAVSFVLSAGDLSFPDTSGRQVTEPGRFQVFVGGSSLASLSGEFVLLPIA